MRFITSTYVFACAMLANLVASIPSAQDFPMTSLTHTLKTRDANGPSIGKKFKNSQGTYWNGSKWVGHCLFQDWPQPAGLPYAAVATNLYGNAAYCGSCIKVTPAGKTGPSKIAMINDQCPDCPNNALDMSPDLYNAVMGNAPGRTGISHFDWEIVQCPIPPSNMKLISKDGASKWHLSLQIAGTITPVVNVSIKPEGKDWQVASRRDYNYWELSEGAAGEQPDVRVTCASGKTVLVNKVKITSRNIVNANGNC
ncbi:uncharacterized protein MELLADRAFT_102573 [Melampsora larici-populina 98AG31]|uniref:Secreted protein n=1 Tax=Melampsora larici-populina (strain 98AG31 / pathotype 3-4-7) TaxID=747676 RepID=F4R776_MELLP|nr:uncharacterized protein MELLADRAFT_102573 [Melampsora larici-populina 98AG31]EGG11541.1 secreted protein [Melampsora larici-populina 98AG31]